MSVPVDYAALAEQYEPLKPFIIITPKGPAIDFSDQKALENRRSYIAWLQDLAAHSCPRSSGFPELVVDIGTGASAVYPLIGCSTWPEVKFIATEMDAVSAHWAQTNIESNSLSDRVKLVLTRPGEPILRPFFDSPAQRAMFTMCNPPFYSSAEEMRELAAKKELPATTVYTGGENESITPGGEVAFVTAMIRESVDHLRDRCMWYTSMLGKASSVEALTEFLRESNVHNYAVSHFVVGNTRRWLIAWSFSGVRLPDELTRSSGIPGFAGNPLSNGIERPFAQRADLPGLLDAILRAIPGLQLSYLAPLPAQYAFTVRVSASSVTWTRKARRAAATTPTTTALPVLICVVFLQTDGDPGRTKLVARWEYGLDRAHFESFAGHIGSKLATQVP